MIKMLPVRAISFEPGAFQSETHVWEGTQELKKIVSLLENAKHLPGVSGPLLTEDI